MKAHVAYLKYILTHKWFVFLECLKLRIPLLGILHDWDKFLPSEWFVYVRTFYEVDGSRKKIDDDLYIQLGHALAQHHYWNKHHWQRFVLIQGKNNIVPLEMPDKYRREMIADWWAVSRVYNTSALSWYMKNRDKMILHPSTRKWLESQL